MSEGRRSWVLNCGGEAWKERIGAPDLTILRAHVGIWRALIWERGDAKQQRGQGRGVIDERLQLLCFELSFFRVLDSILLTLASALRLRSLVMCDSCHVLLQYNTFAPHFWIRLFILFFGRVSLDVVVVSFVGVLHPDAPFLKDIFGWWVLMRILGREIV